MKYDRFPQAQEPKSEEPKRLYKPSKGIADLRPEQVIPYVDDGCDTGTDVASGAE
jgi:hypothetical protein